MERANDKTDELSRMRGDLLTISRRISHDLRTPLGAIISIGEALKESLAEQGSSTAMADSLLCSAEEISRLLKRVSFITQASARPVVKEKMPMALPVSITLQQLESRILKCRATVTEPESWPEIFGVQAWLEVIWRNLTENALQHAGPSPQVDLGWSKNGDDFCFRVDDRGAGVPESVQPRLFQAFDSLHELDSARGLGLSIVRRLVELQGGRCGYEPKPEGGSRFYFTLPANG
jgi:signal transduction histidine kinase